MAGPGDREKRAGEGRPDGRGIRRVDAEDPAGTAADLASELKADVLSSFDEAEQAVGARIQAAARLKAANATPPDIDALRRAASGGLDERAIEKLRQLAKAVDRASRIRSQTEASVTDSLSRRRGMTTGLAVQPSSLRAGSETVAETDRDVATLQEQIDALGPRPDDVAILTPGGQAAWMPQMLDDEAIEKAQTRAWAGGIAAAIIGAAIIPVGLGLVTPLVIPGAVLFALIVALVIVRRGRAARADAKARRQASDSLSLVTATADRAARAAATSRDAIDAWIERRAELDQQLVEAMNTQRAAHKAWESLAGPDADPYDLEAALEANDPQQDVAPESLGTSPSMRTANAYHRKALARWRVAWAATGREEPPEPGQLEEALAEVAAGEPARREAAAQLADAEVLQRPLVLLEPTAGLEGERVKAFERILAQVPAEATVIVVERATDAAHGLEPTG
jgi:hypothetical protein